MSARGDILKVLAFVLTTGLLAALVGALMGNARIESTHSYRAVFSDISGLKDGVDVRAAGVPVGTVRGLALSGDNTVLVTFDVATSIPLTQATRARIRYKNLTGDRYFDLTQGPGDATPLPQGGVIPLARTEPALDLDALFNGFKPLLQGLDPGEVNQLSSSLIEVFQGQSGTVESLLADLGSFTATLADRDQVIGQVISNLNTVLGTIDTHRDEFSTTVDQLQRLISGLAQDRSQLGDSLDRVNSLAGRTGGFLRDLRPELVGTTEQTHRLALALNADLPLLDYNLNQLPVDLARIGRAGAYGSFFNFYLCGIQIRLDGPGPNGFIDTPFLLSDAPRCTFQPQLQQIKHDWGNPDEKPPPDPSSAQPNSSGEHR
jgi:phospholipid/cholesterol/gamma-HCH transport system substrate-binding protein